MFLAFLGSSFMFTTSAIAQEIANAPEAPSFLVSIAPFMLIFAVFYLLLIRPQLKKAKDRDAMLASIRRGDRIVTGGGIVGVVTKVVDENELVLEVAKDVKISVRSALISDILVKTDSTKSEKTTKKSARGGAKKKDANLKELLQGENAKDK
jgi:preprotein translocase subunit YajC